MPDELIEEADRVAISSSGGKDSQAQTSYVVRRAHALGLLDKVVVVHADLGRVEWEGTRELAEEQARLLGVPRFEVVQAQSADLLERVGNRYTKLKAKAELEALERGEDPSTAKVAPVWPSSSARWCTPDAKRGPIRTLYTRLTAELAHLGRPVRILECIGQRAAESTQRAQLAEVEVNRAASNGKRHITTWRPIHGWSDAHVWREIADSGLPYHPAYDWGNRRLSCVFCVLGCVSDLVNGARRVPELAAAYAEQKVAVGGDFRKGLSMAEIIRRAAELDAEHGPAARPPAGTALAGYVGRSAANRYLNRLGLRVRRGIADGRRGTAHHGLRLPGVDVAVSRSPPPPAAGDDSVRTRRHHEPAELRALSTFRTSVPFPAGGLCVTHHAVPTAVPLD